jgi:hypothetical protein
MMGTNLQMVSESGCASSATPHLEVLQGAVAWANVPEQLVPLEQLPKQFVTPASSDAQSRLKHLSRDPEVDKL